MWTTEVLARISGRISGRQAGIKRVEHFKMKMQFKFPTYAFDHIFDDFRYEYETENTTADDQDGADCDHHTATYYPAHCHLTIKRW